MDKSQRTVWAECCPHRCIGVSVGAHLPTKAGTLQALDAGTELTPPNVGRVVGGVDGRGGGSKWVTRQAGAGRGSGWVGVQRARACPGLSECPAPPLPAVTPSLGR